MKVGVKSAAALLLLQVGCSVDLAGTASPPLSIPLDAAVRVAASDGSAGPPLVPDAAAGGASSDAGDGDDTEEDAGPIGPPPPQACGNLAHGASEQRVRYAQAEVANYAQCVPETQTRSCSDGVLSDWSGTAEEPSCTVSLLGVCDGVVACAAGSCVESKTHLFTQQCLGETGQSCADDSACVDTCIEGSCAPLSDAAGACDGHDDCEPLACVGSGKNPRCEQQVCQCENQALCTQNDQCLGTCAAARCVDFDTRCDLFGADDCASTSICQAGWCRRPHGETCAVNDNCRGTCVAGLCAADPGLGGVCDDEGDCGAALTCSAGQCLLEDGFACDAPEECAAGTCGCEKPPCQGQTYCGVEANGKGG